MEQAKLFTIQYQTNTIHIDAHEVLEAPLTT